MDGAEIRCALRVARDRPVCMNNENPVLITLSSLIFFAAVTLAQTPESRQSSLPDGAVAHRDIAYVPSGHERQRLDLYLPREGTNLPLIINIHGGAFKMGSKEQGVPLEYLTQGYAVA